MKRLLMRALPYAFPSLMLIFFALIVAPYIAHAADAVPCTASFCPLADVKGSKLEALYSTDQNLVTYLNTLFKFAIGVGAIAAVLKMVYAGYMYMASDVWTSKEKARGVFRDVFLGLFLLLSIYIILYQINPNLLNLDTKISPVDNVPAGPSTSIVGIQPIVASGCAGCVPIPSGVPSKGVGLACSGTGPCMVSSTMASKLKDLVVKAIGLSWQVTEAYPPTVAHSGPTSCHNNGLGTCVDVNFIGSPPTAANIVAFINDARASGLTAQWEVGNSMREQSLRDAGVPITSILVTGNQEHFHITGG